jgi:hypothetical protein
MQLQDAIYYGGLITGMILGTLMLREFGVPGLGQLIGGFALGVGIGYVAEQAYRKSREP